MPSSSAAGPDLRFVSSRGGNWYPTFMDLQVATDRRGLAHGYLATEAQYTRAARPASAPT